MEGEREEEWRVGVKERARGGREGKGRTGDGADGWERMDGGWREDGEDETVRTGWAGSRWEGGDGTEGGGKSGKRGTAGKGRDDMEEMGRK